MPNSIKYSTSSESNSLTSGNFHLGVGDVDKGPTSTTGYYNGINPPSGGYTIYLNKASDGPSIYTPANDTELISLTNSIGAQSFTTAAQCKEWFVGQNDKMLVNREYENIVTDGLVFMVDAGFTPSYPGSGTTWTDLVGSNNGSLINGPTFDSGNGGGIVFDGTNDKVNVSSDALADSSEGTVLVWIKGTEKGGIYNCQSGGGNQNTLGSSTNTARWAMGFGNGDFQLRIGDGAHVSLTTTDSVYDNNYHMVGSSWTSGSEWNLWIDAVKKATGTNPKAYTKGTTLEIGWISWDPSAYFEGTMYIFLSYNRALSSTEVLQNYNAQKGRFGIT